MENFSNKHTLLFKPLTIICFFSICCKYTNINNDSLIYHSREGSFKIRRVGAYADDTVSNIKQILFIVEYKSKKLPNAIQFKLDSIVCNYISTEDFGNLTPYVFVIKESKETRSWSSTDSLFNFDLIYDTDLFYYAEYSWNTITKDFIMKSDNLGNKIETKFPCGNSGFIESK